RGLKLVPFLQGRIDPDGSGYILLISGVIIAVAGLVLLIAWANVVNLLLSKTVARRKEIAIRMALGASRMRIVRQVVTENILLSLMGGIIGVLTARWTRDLLRSLNIFSGTGRLNISTGRLDFDLDLRVLGFALLITLVSGLVLGLVPGIQGSRSEIMPTLKGETRSDTRRKFGPSLREGLVITQIALSLISIVGAVL